MTVHPLVEDLTAERQRRGLSVHRAGQLAGLGHGTVRLWERGERNPCLLELSQYAASLGCAITLTPAEDVAF